MTPTWPQGGCRLEHLHDHGPSAFAFTFKTPFDAEDRPTRVNREAVKRKMAENRRRQAQIQEAVPV